MKNFIELENKFGGNMLIKTSLIYFVRVSEHGTEIFLQNSELPALAKESYEQVKELIKKSTK